MTCTQSGNAILYDSRGPFVRLAAGTTMDIGVDWRPWLAAQGLTQLDSSAWDAAAGVTLSAPELNDAAIEQTVDGTLQTYPPRTLATVLVTVPPEAERGAEVEVSNTVTAAPYADLRRLRVVVA